MEGKKPHVVCVPCPAQGHIIPMMQLAKLLHSRGFLITFVNTDFSHKHLLRSRGADSSECLDGFRFETISDGLSSLGEAMEDPVGFTKSFQENCVSPFRDLLTKLHHPSDGSRVTCIIADAIMTYTIKIAEELGIPEVLFCSNSACGQMAYFHYQELIRRGLVPLKGKTTYPWKQIHNTAGGFEIRPWRHKGVYGDENGSPAQITAGTKLIDGLWAQLGTKLGSDLINGPMKIGIKV